MYHFIYWIAQDFESLKSMIQQQFNILRNKNLGLFKHKRFGETVAIYNIVCRIFINYCVSIGQLEPIKNEEILNNWEDIIFNVIKAHEIANIKEEPAIMYLTAIQELITSNKCKLLKKDDSASNKSKSIGYYDEEKYYLFPQ